MAERLKALAWGARARETESGVRIPLAIHEVTEAHPTDTDLSERWASFFDKIRGRRKSSPAILGQAGIWETSRLSPRAFIGRLAFPILGTILV